MEGHTFVLSLLKWAASASPAVVPPLQNRTVWSIKSIKLIKLQGINALSIRFNDKPSTGHNYVIKLLNPWDFATLKLSLKLSCVLNVPPAINKRKI